MDNGYLTHDYIYNGTRLAVDKWGGKSLHFIYDESGAPYAFVYDNGTTEKVYYYITNLQGDVTAIVDQNINVVARYVYDAWGKVLSTDNYGTDNIGTINPLRYRGYYYDAEIGWYYLVNRYYDPSVGRFINEDAFVSTGSGFLGYNMFAYCNNNPVMEVDDFGTNQSFSILVTDSPWYGKEQDALATQQYYEKKKAQGVVNEYPEIKRNMDSNNVSITHVTKAQVVKCSDYYSPSFGERLLDNLAYSFAGLGITSCLTGSIAIIDVVFSTGGAIIDSIKGSSLSSGLYHHTQVFVWCDYSANDEKNGETVNYTRLFLCDYYYAEDGSDNSIKVVSYFFPKNENEYRKLYYYPDN